jgi:hypothetical protein
MAHKLSQRSTPCVILGYPTDHRGYCCLDIHTRRVITSRHVVFDETRFPFLLVLTEPNPTTGEPATVDSDGPILIQQRGPSPVPTATDSSGTHSSSPSSSSTPSSSAAPIAAHSSPVQASAATGHHMQTCSRAGIYKPNPKYALSSDQSSTHTTISPIPKYVQTALHDPNWRPTMAAEYDAL